MNNLIFEDSKEIQSVFQTVKMQFQHGRNSDSRSSCWTRTSSNKGQQSQSCKGMEYTYQDKKDRKFSRICKFLLVIYQEFQSYSETSQ